MQQDSELQLILSAKTNLRAFGQLYDKYYPEIFRYALNQLADKESAEDIVSLVFEQMISLVKKFDEKKYTSLKPWLFRITHNKIVDYQRGRKYPVNLDELDGQPSPDEPDHDKEIDNELMQKRIAYVFSQINPRYSQILALKYYEELDNEEISSIMEVKPKQVAVLLFRALESFREEFIRNFPKSEIFQLLNS